ncbi:MAG: hypothetical protein JNG85_00230, partial [Spirochaetaceae bacterium]|nr:hypothetical protein [Spirochaetaceae bacterium]
MSDSRSRDIRSSAPSGGPGGPGGPGGRGGFGHGPAMGRPAEKAKDFKTTLRRLLRYLAPRKGRLLAVLVLAIASTVFTIASPKIMGGAMNKVRDSFVARMLLEQAEGIRERLAAAAAAATAAAPAP